MVTNILSYLENSATKWPEKIAIADDKNYLTFTHWLTYAQSIGTAILNATGRSIRKPILVFVDRKIECLVGFMGVVESGNFYVPIDCKMPFERVKLINDVLTPIAAITVTDADNKTLDQIDFKGKRFNYSEAIEHVIDINLLNNTRSQIIDLDPVYCLFTSGSTGVPKGVVISQRGMIDLTEWLVNTFEFDETDSLGNQTPFYFDGSVKDICICTMVISTPQPKHMWIRKKTVYILRHSLQAWCPTGRNIYGEPTTEAESLLSSPLKSITTSSSMTRILPRPKRLGTTV